MSMNKKHSYISKKEVIWAKKPGHFGPKNVLNQPLTGLNPSKYLEQL